MHPEQRTSITGASANVHIMPAFSCCPLSSQYELSQSITITKALELNNFVKIHGENSLVSDFQNGFYLRCPESHKEGVSRAVSSPLWPSSHLPELQKPAGALDESLRGTWVMEGWRGMASPTAADRRWVGGRGGSLCFRGGRWQCEQDFPTP